MDGQPETGREESAADNDREFPIRRPRGSPTKRTETGIADETISNKLDSSLALSTREMTAGG